MLRSPLRALLTSSNVSAADVCQLGGVYSYWWWYSDH